jgi:hypothetical protein
MPKYRVTPAAQRAGREVVRARAAAKTADLAPIVKEQQASGVTTLQGIADELNRRGIPTAAGRGLWQPVQVQRVLRRIAASVRQFNFI